MKKETESTLDYGRGNRENLKMRTVEIKLNDPSEPIAVFTIPKDSPNYRLSAFDLANKCFLAAEDPQGLVNVIEPSGASNRFDLSPF